jgi:hypothetical protein
MYLVPMISLEHEIKRKALAGVGTLLRAVQSRGPGGARLVVVRRAKRFREGGVTDDFAKWETVKPDYKTPSKFVSPEK